MRAIKRWATVVGMMSVALTGCMAEEAPLEEAGADVGVDVSSSELTQQARKRPHCVVEAVALHPGEAPPEEPSAASPRCFDTFSDALFAATDGRVRLPPSVTAETLDDAMLRGGDEHADLATYVIGIEYQHAWFQGATLTITSSVSCYGYNHWFPYSSFPAGWNDIISSARAFSGCNHSYHYEHDFSGAVVDCGTACGYIGDAMNDRTSSLFWTY